MRLTEVLYNPDGFFEEAKEKGIGFAIPFLIVLISGILGGITTYIIVKSILTVGIEKIPGEQNKALIQFLSAGTIPAVIIMNLIGWILLSAVIYLISRFFSKEGNFSLMLKFMGFSYIPSIIFFPFNLYVSLSLSDLIKSIGFEELAKTELWAASKITSLAVLAWQFTFWVFAVKNVRNITLGKAVISASVPALALLIFTLISYRF